MKFYFLTPNHEPSSQSLTASPYETLSDLPALLHALRAQPLAYAENEHIYTVECGFEVLVSWDASGHFLYYHPLYTPLSKWSISPREASFRVATYASAEAFHEKWPHLIPTNPN